jgi:uncharacterized protein involved in outer membrane biogenesis
LRESLTVLAGLLILCLSIALAAPYFVDWNAQRGLIETKLSQALGEKVIIRGNLDLKLLPTPYLHLQKIEISDAAASASFAADDVLLEIAIPPLLRGEVDFIEARVKSPRLKLIQGTDGTLKAPQPGGFSGQARFERIAIEDGRIEIEDPAQANTLVLDHLDLNAEANSLAGPFKGDGSGMVLGEKTGFRFSTGQREGDSLRLKLVVDKSKTHPRADFDGTLTFEHRRNGRLAASFTGNAGFSGLWRGASEKSDIAIPWHLAGPLRIAERKATMDTLDLRLGDDDHGVNTTGTAELDFAATPKASVNLRAKQIDIDRLLADPAKTQTPETLEQSLTGLMNESRLSTFPIPLTLDATVETATVNGETLADLSGALVLNQNQPVWVRFETSLPGRSHVHLDGRLEAGAAMQFDGRIEAGFGDFGRMNAWLAGVLPHWAEETRKLPFRTLEVSGETSLSRVGFSGRGLSLRLDRSNLTGNLSYTQAVGAEPARFFVDMSAPSLDLDGWPDLKDAAHLVEATDLAIRFDAHAVKLGGLRKGTVDTGEIRLKLTKTGANTNLEELSLNGVGGANVNAKGQWNGQSGGLDAKLNAPRLADLTAFLQRVVPSAALDMVAERATALSPMQLDLHAEAGSAAPSSAPAPALTALTLTGAAGATHISANVKSNPKNPSLGTASATIEAPDGSALLRQLGAQVVPLNGLGRGHIEIKTQGPLSGSPDMTLQVTLAGLNINFHGQVEQPKSPGPETLAANGQLTVAGTDLSPFLQATGLAFPDLTARIPVDVATDIDWRASRLDLRNLRGTFAGRALSGRLTYALQDGVKKLTGALDLDKTSAAALLELPLGPPQPAKGGTLWSNLSFGSGLPDPPPASITLRAKTFDILPGLSGEDAALQLEIAPGVFTFRDFTMKTGGGTAAGTLALRRDGATAAVAGHINLENYGFDFPSLHGRASAALDISGSAQNAFALMSNLAGSGHASFNDLIVRRADPAAIARVFADVEHDKLAVDEAEVERALGREFDRAGLNAGARPFDLAVVGGVLRLTPAPVKGTEGNPVSLDEFSLSLDLRTAAIDERLGLALLALPKDWQGSPPRVVLNFKGALTNPARMIEAASFVNALASRAIAREAARIQSYEFDLHERAFFNQRLQYERRREQERQKAEDDARRAEAERKAAEAARIERLKKAEEARKKAEELLRTNAAPEAQPAQDPQSNAPQSQRPVTPADPSSLGRY